VTNDEDSGNHAYWALDNYQKSLIVWQSLAIAGPPAPEGSFMFCALAQYDGSWQTFSGALSPETGVVEPNDGTGPFSGGYVATFTAIPKTTPDKPTSGYIGSFDYGGTKADILAPPGTQTGGTPIDVTGFYFIPAGHMNPTFMLPTWGWIYNQGAGVGYGNLWANIASGSFGDIVATQGTQGCQEADGNGHFQGNHGNGDFAMDDDSCEDGDNNNVQMSDRGDGQSFQSTSINSMNFDPLTNALTLTGLGTTNGLPVAFTLVAIETGATTPGWVSFVSSDGYSNAGPLTDGSIVLH